VESGLGLLHLAWPFTREFDLEEVSQSLDILVASAGEEQENLLVQAHPCTLSTTSLSSSDKRVAQNNCQNQDN
jgi:hypothetical protein